VDTISLRRLYVLFFIHNGTRRVFLARITTNPTRDWVTQCARNMTEDLRVAGVAVKYLLGDRDAKFAPGFDAVGEGEGASIVRSPVRTPNANAIAERGIRTVRSESTDRILILNERRLRRMLDRYVRHYNEHRPQRGLTLRPPQRSTVSRPPMPETIPGIRRREILGGLINEYYAA